MITIYQIKFCLQSNTCVNLSREWIDLVWLNVLVRVYTLQKLEAWTCLRPWPNPFSSIEWGRWTCIFCSWCSDIGCWEVLGCHTVLHEMSALSRSTSLCSERPLMVSSQTSILLVTGPTCPACSKTISPGSLQTQLEVQILQEHIAKYYEGWTVCDDPMCDYSTRMMGVYGQCCLRSGCKGRVAFKVTWYPSTHSGTITDQKYEYSNTQLYNQLLYFMSLFDANKALNAINFGSRCTPWHLGSFSSIFWYYYQEWCAVGRCVEKHLNNCGRRWVDLKAIHFVLSRAAEGNLSEACKTINSSLLWNLRLFYLAKPTTGWLLNEPSTHVRWYYARGTRIWGLRTVNVWYGLDGHKSRTNPSTSMPMHSESHKLGYLESTPLSTAW